MAASQVFAAGNVAVITGASSGIGLAAAKKCAALQMKVVLADIDQAELEVPFPAQQRVLFGPCISRTPRGQLDATSSTA